MHVTPDMLFQTPCLDFLALYSSSVDGGESVDDMEDMAEDMELEQLHTDSAYESFSSQGSLECEWCQQAPQCEMVGFWALCVTLF